MFIALIIVTTALPKLFNVLSKIDSDSIGITAPVEGTVSNKKFVAAHSEKSWFLFSYSSKYYPDKWQLEIRRYDSSAKKWETATCDVDQTTYAEITVGDYYQAPANQTTFFLYDS